MWWWACWTYFTNGAGSAEFTLRCWVTDLAIDDAQFVASEPDRGLGVVICQVCGEVKDGEFAKVWEMPMMESGRRREYHGVSCENLT